MRCLGLNQTAIAIVASLLTSQVWSAIPSITGPSFQLKATTGFISTPDGNSILIWGFQDNRADAPVPNVQYPGPTLEVTQNDPVQVTLTSDLEVPVSLVFPGQSGVTATAGTPGLLANEIDGGSALSITYEFTASQPGTYTYHSGSIPDLQVEMGLIGALIVRPANYQPGNATPEEVKTLTPQRRAYNHFSTRYNREYLYLLSEMDPRIHRMIQLTDMTDANARDDVLAEIDTATFFPVYWFINGRCAPDVFHGIHPGLVTNPDQAAADWLPTQPYNIVPRMHPGEQVLLRVIGGGRDLHPFHHHGNHTTILAKDGRLLTSGDELANNPPEGTDIAFRVFTIDSAPGQTVDALFTWSARNLGFDIYGHAPGDAMEPGEFAADHGKPLPVLLPEGLDLGFGGWWPGSEFLGQGGSLPPGEGGLNPNGAQTFLWHSHTEKELANNDIFPGGMLSMLFIEHPTQVTIVE